MQAGEQQVETQTQAPLTAQCPPSPGACQGETQRPGQEGHGSDRVPTTGRILPSTPASPEPSRKRGLVPPAQSLQGQSGQQKSLPGSVRLGVPSRGH